MEALRFQMTGIVLGFLFSFSSTFGSHHQANISLCLQNSLKKALITLDQAPGLVILCEHKGFGCHNFGFEERKPIQSVVMESFCDVEQLVKIFQVINCRKDSTVVIITRNACVGTILNLINQSDDVFDQHGYFTFIYKWILVTDFYNSTTIHTQASKIIHLSVLTCQAGLPYTPLMYYLGWVNLSQRRTSVGFWPPKTADDIFPLKKYGLNGVQLTAAVNMWSPFLVKDTHGGYSGMAVDIFQLFAQKLNFSFVFVEPLDGEWGVKNPNGSWTGLVGQMVKKEADVVCASLTQSFQRTQVMDFPSLPYYTEYRALIYRRLDPSASLLGVIAGPLKKYVWLSVIAAILGMAFVFWMAGFVEEDSSMTTRSRCLLYACSIILQQGSPRLPKSCSSRLLVASYWFFAITLAAVYSANLTAFLTVSTVHTPFKTLEDIAQQTEYQIGYPGGGFSEMFFMTATKEPYMTIASRAMKAAGNKPLKAEYSYHLNKVQKGKYIFIGAYSYIMTTASCTYAVEKTPLEEHYNLGLRKNSAFTTHLDQLMVRIHENGLLLKLIAKYQVVPQKNSLTCSVYAKPGSVHMHLESMTGIMIIIGTCLTAATLSLAAEIVFDLAKKRHWLFWW